MTDLDRCLSAIEPQAVVDLVAELVRIPSINWGPAGEQGGGTFEQEIGVFVAEYFGRAGLEPQVQPVADHRANVVARLPGAGPRVLWLDAHMDTVPVEGMEGDPFSGEVRDGRLYGRGSCDTKATLGAMMYAVGLLARQGATPPASVVLTATVDEEARCGGILRLKESGLTADGAVVGEPTELNLVAATKGAARWQVRTRGVGVHTCHPEKGHNAVYDMARVITALEDRLIPSLQRKSHPLVGSPRLTVSLIRGGQRCNIVPDECVVDLDRRVLPGETPEEVIGGVGEFLQELSAEIPGLQVEMLPPYTFVPGTEATPDDEVYQALHGAIAGALGSCQVVGVPYTTHCSIIEQMGIPSVTFGPGSIEQAHTINEWVATEQIVRAAETLVRLCLTFGATALS